MTPASAIAILDRQVASSGETVILRRGDTERAFDAFVRGYRPDELVGGIDQGDTLVVVSPTALGASVFAADGPSSSDEMIVGGRLRHISSVEPVRLRDAVVRYNLTVRG